MPPSKIRPSMSEVPTDTPTKFDLGDTTADIQMRREEREQREEWELHSHRQRRQWPERPRTGRSEGEIETKMSVEERPVHLLNFNPGTIKGI